MIISQVCVLRYLFLAMPTDLAMASEALGSFTTPCKVHVAIVPALHCMGSNVQGNGEQEARNGVTEIYTTPLDIEASMSVVHFYTHNARSPQTPS